MGLPVSSFLFLFKNHGVYSFRHLEWFPVIPWNPTRNLPRISIIPVRFPISAWSTFFNSLAPSISSCARWCAGGGCLWTARSLSDEALVLLPEGKME
ncbi:hypothetical protein SLEP1_g51107 [Rubroshorea leprosula]|uniref:Uncharacterized protein n=1 Tax=Rubroshorea leprosula TaxID=152421 RepID=A0AAV5M5P6_9ROSI|nr:hypothetical protein SLEP1_g51107 [Rubroshorea leprosula]